MAFTKRIGEEGSKTGAVLWNSYMKHAGLCMEVRIQGSLLQALRVLIF